MATKRRRSSKKGAFEKGGLLVDSEGYGKTWPQFVLLGLLAIMVWALWSGPGQSPENVAARKQMAQQSAQSQAPELCGGVTEAQFRNWESRALQSHDQVYQEIVNAVLPPGKDLSGLNAFQKFDLISCPSSIMWDIDARVGYEYPK